MYIANRNFPVRGTLIVEFCWRMHIVAKCRLAGLFGHRAGRRRPSRRYRAECGLAGLEAMDRRVLPAVTAAFLPAAGVLTVFGVALDNTIVVSRDAAGNILVNNNSVAISGGTPTVANTSLIQILGQAGN